MSDSRQPRAEHGVPAGVLGLLEVLGPVATGLGVRSVELSLTCRMPSKEARIGQAHASFDVAAALLALQDLAEAMRHSSLPGLEPAWEAAWIACLTYSDAWTAVAEAAFERVLAEYAGDAAARSRSGAAGTAAGGAGRRELSNPAMPRLRLFRYWEG